MRYTLWGCGKLGKVMLMLLGKDIVSAFIDSNEELQGTLFMEIPIIDFDTYLQQKKNELIIITVKGHKRDIGQRLDKAGIPWIAIDEYKYLIVLNQIRLGIEKILKQDEAKGMSLIYGWNVYGLYLYEWMKAHDRKCGIILQDNVSDRLSQWARQELPLIDVHALQRCSVERVFCTQSVKISQWLKGICDKQTNAYEIYKESDLFCNPELKRFHNIHKGKRCFIVATGPSLRIEDLDTLEAHGEICMSVNGIFKAFDMTNWKPDYYFLDDFSGLLNWKKDILKMEVREKFIADAAWWFEDSEVASNIHRFHLYPDYPQDGLPQFTEDFSECAYCSMSIIYDGALQMAVYMGFSEIYMLGADCTIESSQKKQHFVENYDDEKFSKAYGLDIEKVFKGYVAAKKYCEQHGIRLYNATRGGKLEVLERVDFDSLF